MFYKRIVVYVPDEQIYKALKHKVVDDDSTISALVLKLIMQYLSGGNNKPAVADAPVAQSEAEKETEAEFWDKEAKDLDNAMPCHNRAKKAPVIEPVEMSIREYENVNEEGTAK